MSKYYIQMASYVMSGSALPFLDQIRDVNAIGYDGVELAGLNYGGLSAGEFRQFLDSEGLSVIGAHIPFDQIISVIDDIHTLGFKNAVVPNYPLKTHKDALELANKLNALGKALKSEDISLLYHNHNTEFFVDEESTLLQTLIDETDSDLVSFELDAGWAAAAGIDVNAFIRKNCARIHLLHANEADTVIGPVMLGRPIPSIPIGPDGSRLYTPEEAAFHRKRKECDCPMGHGIPEWTTIKELAVHAEAYIVERRYAYQGTPSDCFAEDLAFMKRLL